MQKHVDKHNPHFKYNPCVVAKLVSLQDYFDSQSKDVMIVNDLKMDSEQAREEVRNYLTTTYTGDTEEMVAGKNPLFEEIKPSMWIKTITKGGYYINPRFLTMLTTFLKTKRFDVVRHMLDPSYGTPAHMEDTTVKRYLELCENGSYKRGFKEFYEHFDGLMDLFILNKYYRAQDRRNALNSRRRRSSPTPLDYMAQLVLKYRNEIFSTHIPIPSKHLFVMEKKGKSFETEIPLMQQAFDAVSTVASIKERLRPLSEKDEGRLDYKINYTCMSVFHENYNYKYTRSKKGFYRLNIFGTTTSFNSRAVIVSLQGIRDYDKIEISYPIAFKIFECQVAKILLDRGDTPTMVFEKRSKYAKSFSQEIYDILCQLMKDFWYGEGWVTGLLRHPYLHFLSRQYVGIPTIGRDPSQNVIKLPTPILAGFNADFDGDEMIITPALDKYTADLHETLKPHYSALDTNTALSYASELNTSKPLVPAYYYYLNYDKPFKRKCV